MNIKHIAGSYPKVAFGNKIGKEGEGDVLGKKIGKEEEGDVLVHQSWGKRKFLLSASD